MPFAKREDTRTPAQHKADFLVPFRETGNVALACRRAKVGRRTVYTWLKDDGAFLADFRDAEIEATENLEAEAYRRAVKGVKRHKGFYYLGVRVGEDIVTEYSDNLLTLLLKGRAPEKYRDKQETTVNLPGVAPRLDLSKLSDEELSVYESLTARARS